MSLRTLIVVGACCVVLAPRDARADWFLNPFLGGAFGGAVAEPAKVEYGASVGWLGRMLGFEVELGHRPDFFEVDDVPDFIFSESSVTSVMFNAIVAVPSGRLGTRVRPYAAGGIGWLRSRIGGADDFIRGRNDHIGFNVGGGVLGRLTERFGVRGDVRYIRDLQELKGESEFFSVGRQQLDFWRATGGVTFRF